MSVLQTFKAQVEKAVWEIFGETINFTRSDKLLTWLDYEITFDDDAIGLFIVITNHKINYQSIFPTIDSNKDILYRVGDFLSVYSQSKITKWIKENDDSPVNK